MKNGVIWTSLTSLRVFLTSTQKRYGVFILFLLLINSVLDVFGLAALVPVIMVASEPGAVLKNKFFNAAYQFFAFSTERSFLTSLIIGVFMLFILKNVFSTWLNYLQNRFTVDVGLTLINKQMDKYLSFSFWWFNDLGHSNLSHNIVGITSSYVMGILRQLFVLMAEIAVVSIIVIGIVVYKPILLLLLAIILVPTTVLTYGALRNRSLAIGNRLNELRPISGARLHDIILGYAELKLANKIKKFRTSFFSVMQEIQVLDAESYLFGQLPLKVIELVAILGVVIIFLYALYFSDNPASLIGLVGIFAAAAYRLMPSVNRMLTSLVQLKQYQYTIEVLNDHYQPFLIEPSSPQQQPLTFNNTIEFKNVGFTFPKENSSALTGINLTIRKGEKIGFIGSSGSGKTTLMNLLLRFYTEQEGAINIDGQPLTPQFLESWHKILGYVKQDTFLMEASIKDNITLNEVDVDESRLAYALEQSSLNSFVSSLPNGINSSIGERGSKLSGGQRQRVGIARALYKQTQVLVLDEATSALDNQTEREVNEAINKLSSTDITILIIAHRITTLRECDRIYELKDGRLIGEYQYADLVKH